MDILDRLSYLLRSAIEESSSSSARRGAEGGDPDWREAWNELDEYMKYGSAQGSGSQQGSASARDSRRWGQGSSRQGSSRRDGSTAPDIPHVLRKDFEALEVAPGAPIKEVRKHFRRELARYHPDHFADDPEKFKAATAVTRELIQSYRRIRDYYGAEES